MQYGIVIEWAEGNYSAYVPDLPGCAAVGDTVDEVRESIRTAIAYHLQGLREDGVTPPSPSSRLEYVEVA